MLLVDPEEFIGMEFSKSSSRQTTFGSFVPASSSKIYQSAFTLYETFVNAFVIQRVEAGVEENLPYKGCVEEDC